MGSGYFRSQTLFPLVPRLFDADSPLRMGCQPSVAAPGRRPLLLWHGDADDVVPPEETFRLQQALRQAGWTPI
jgi:fermentation-respiration switch protein FrsA (DUF1100 family)